MKSVTARLIAMAILASSVTTHQVLAECSPRVVRDDTAFPTRAQLRGQEGTVFLDVVIDANGAPADAQVVDSSGFRVLDGAARKSVLTQWQFDVSNCERKDLPITQRVAIEYRNDEYSR